MSINQKFNDSTKNRPWGERPIDAPILTIDIPAFIQLIKSEEAWLKNDRNAITVFKTDHIRQVVVALHKDAEMARQRSEGVMTIQVLEGRLLCSAEEWTAMLTKGQMVAIHEGMPYSLKAAEEASFLLTMMTTGK
jgi:quercetin dioxygenase-like cupin family protein